MLRTLIRKQLTEIFRGYFTDRKKNTARSKAMTILLFVVFGVMMVGVLGGMFWGMAWSICTPLRQAGTLWLYFALMGLLSMFLGVFGSVFSTYQGLYLAKDNDLLLSMPIPVRTILLSRLVSVYLIGLMYSAVVCIPTVIVAWVSVPLRMSAVVGGIVWVLLLSVVVLILSCLLGWVVARISLRLKNKSFITVFISLLFISVYYFCYFKAQQWIQTLIANAAAYGERIKGAAYGIYLFGRAGEGAGLPLLLVTAVIGALFAVTCIVLSRSFLRIATTTGAVAKTKYREKAAKRRSASRALLMKELGRFTASPNYMLNTGLGVIMLPLAGIAMLWKGPSLFAALENALGDRSGAAGAILCAAICFCSSMNDMAAPSVSLEGKNVWLVQSLPVTAKQVLQAKLHMQLLLTVVPVLFFAVCTAIVVPENLAARVMLVCFALVLVWFAAVYDLALGLRWHNLSWTNELTPIKQSAATAFAVFGLWLYAILIGGLYLLIGTLMGLALYLAAVSALTAIASALLYRWVMRKGTIIFENL